MLGGSADDRNKLAAPHLVQGLVMRLPGPIQSLVQRKGLHDESAFNLDPACNQQTDREIVAIPSECPAVMGEMPTCTRAKGARWKPIVHPPAQVG